MARVLANISTCKKMSRIRKVSVGLWSLLFLLPGCVKTEGFECETNDECGQSAQCEPEGVCSFVDATCETGFRFGEESGEVGGECTLPGKDIFDDGPTIVDNDSDDNTQENDGEPFALSNVVLSDWHKKTGAVVLDNTSVPYVFDTDSGVITLENDSEELFEEEMAFSIASQFNGPNTGVLVLGQLDISPGAVLKVRGTNSGVIVASQSITIAGQILADAGQGRPDLAGPGGYSGGQSLACDGGGPGGGGFGGSPDFGAGGGGHVAKGGKGGDWGGEPFSPGGLGGEAHGNINLTPLIGGSGGGCGGGNTDVARGGGGGGALQLSAGESIVVQSAGALSANGAGGEGGSSDNAGAGGGAGGSILLESKSIAIDGNVSANGGGGGAGADGDVKGADGEAGRLGRGIALGGVGAGQGASGGNGGAGADAKGRNGTDTTGQVATDDNAGGGGGGGGRVRVRGRNISVGGVVSPNAGYEQSRDI